MGFCKKIEKLPVKTLLLAGLALGGCVANTLPYMRNETAQRIAAPAWMIKREIPAGLFVLRAYERIHERGSVANIYIEGDGTAIHNTSTDMDVIGDPTPMNPIGLHLASKDRGQNVIYLARPCQFTGTEECDEKYWADSRFSEEVIESYNVALDDIIKRYDISAFNLIGYAGGATIASILSVKRKDVLTLRTVSGIMDIDAFTTASDMPAMDNSINPTDLAQSLVNVPQYHFMGGQDFTVPPVVTHSYLQSIPPSGCIQTMLVQEAGYEDGWVNKWPELLELPVRCTRKSFTPDFGEYTPPVEPASPAFITREKPAKP